MEPLAASFGMCGRLPFAQTLTEMCHSNVDSEEGELEGTGSAFDPFERDDEGIDKDPATSAISWLKDELKVQGTSIGMTRCDQRSRPCLWFAGAEGHKVNVVLGRAAYRMCERAEFRRSVEKVGVPGPLYSGEMLRDLVELIRRRSGTIND